MSEGPLHKLSDEELWARRQDREALARLRAAGKDPTARGPGSASTRRTSTSRPTVHYSDADPSTKPVWVLGIGLVVLVLALAAVWFGTAG